MRVNNSLYSAKMQYDDCLKEEPQIKGRRAAL